ncbi:MAG: His/Gly/Thr/Pro-type tRNA ligase C-terminal domain-containing protein, partial [Candidatus Nanopelagicales bacterium]|nr:His/Gly/Thr/Pro-type tRNA ligase C-terminal domain-containing protein [Candidatus Nanopelagicales bacterium]
GKGEVLVESAEAIATDLEDAGVRVLIDDRRASAGVKFNDAELIGVPRILVVGRRLAEGLVELRDRSTGEREEVPVDRVVSLLAGSAT